MRKTKILALLLVVVIVASMVVPSVSAEDTYEAYMTEELTGADSATVEAGQKFAVYVSIAGNPGISAITMRLQYPEGWSVSYFEDCKLFDAKATTLPTFTNANPYYLQWVMPYGTTPGRNDPGKKLSFENGDLCLVEFEVPADALSGEYELSLSTEGLGGDNYKEATDANGVIIEGGTAIGNVCPDTSKKFVVTVNGVEPEVPAGAACPEHTDVTTWTEIAEGTWTGGAIEAGHYKLTGNQATTSALTIAGNVCIDLNGYNITAGAKAASGSYRAFEIAEGAHLVIADSAETDGVISGGRVRASSSTNATTAVDGFCCGGNIYNAGTLSLYGGVIAGGIATASSVSYSNYGGNIYGTVGSVINVHGGQIKDGVLYKGTICYGTSKSGGGWGGNIYTCGTLNMTDGIISGGHYDGYNDPTVDKYNGTNRVANKVNGGNIAISSGEMYMSGGLITEGAVVNNLSTTTADSTTVYAMGGNLWINSSKVEITGGTISNGRVETGSYSPNFAETAKHDVASRGGNIYITGASSTMLIKNATVIGGVAEQSCDSNKGYDKTTGAQTTSYGSSQGGNIYISNGTVTIENSIIKDGQSDYRGGNFAIGTGTLNIIDSQILNGTLKNELNRNIATGEAGELYAMGTGPRGADIYASGDITINISGNTVFAGASGSDYVAGQCINVRGNTVVNIYGGDLSDQSSAFDGNKAANLYGGKLKNDDKQLGKNLLVVDNKAVILDGTVYAPAADLTAALAAAAEGSKVIMLADATAEEVLVPAGVTLDLNGKTLTAGSVTASVGGAQVIGAGLLATESASFSPNNAQLPVKTADGYVFETVKFAEKLEATETKVVYKYYIQNAAEATLIDDAIKAGETVGLEVKVTWTENGEAKYKVFTLDTTLVEEFAENWDTKAIVLTINDITGISDVVCTAQVTVNGVTVTA